MAANTRYFPSIPHARLKGGIAIVALFITLILLFGMYRLIERENVLRTKEASFVTFDNFIESGIYRISILDYGPRMTFYIEININVFTELFNFFLYNGLWQTKIFTIVTACTFILS